jgi:hypothetical protein
MGEAEDGQFDADQISGGTQEDRGGVESTVGEGEERRLKEPNRTGSVSHSHHGQV